MNIQFAAALLMLLVIAGCSPPASSGDVYSECVRSFESDLADLQVAALRDPNFVPIVDRYPSAVREGCTCVKDDVVPALRNSERDWAVQYFEDERSLRSFSDGETIAFNPALMQISSCLNDAFISSGVSEMLSRAYSSE